MSSFREKNPVIIGAVSLATIAMLMVVAFKAGDLPLIGGGDKYYAAFSEGSGLKVDDEVRIAGVRVGKVTGIGLEGDHVRVEFKLKTDSKFGTDTIAEIKVKTLLGAMFLALVPKGPGQLPTGSEIPVAHTRSAFDVVDAFSGLAERTEKINVSQLAQSLNTVAAATKGTPAAFQGTLKGLSALSANVAARDAQLNSLLKNLHTVSGTLANRDDDVVALMKDGDTLLRALVGRRDAVHRLLVSTSNLSIQLTALVSESRADLKPALTHLQSVANVLLKNQNNLDQSLRLLAPFYRVFTNTLGNGPWFDTWIANLPPVPGLGG
ncbi:MAG: virulence factor Mce family protein [Marmoricola sp.]|jgi:phospholipid/cholesterol/gamma-HCH transport system substrate-binding protein|nr:virulence factor Mce family protein [Marmoricola sp.]